MNSDLGQLVALFFVFGGGFWVLAPLAKALAKRIQGPANSTTEPAAIAELRDELRSVRQELAELGERIDFTERVLAKQDPRDRLPPPG